MAQQKFITSHSFRVKRANEYRKRSGEKISIIDREAIVELYLLEDIKRLYASRLEKALRNHPTTPAGIKANESNKKIFKATLHLLTSAIEVCNERIGNGDFTEVWKAIPEGPLMRAAGSTKYLDKMKEMISSLLGELSQEALFAVQKVIENEEALAEINDHEANAAAYRGIDMEEFEAIVTPTEQVVAKNENIAKPKSKPNIN